MHLDAKQCISQTGNGKGSGCLCRDLGLGHPFMACAPKHCVGPGCLAERLWELGLRNSWSRGKEIEEENTYCQCSFFCVTAFG